MRKFIFFLWYIPLFFLASVTANAQIAVTRSGTAVTSPALAASYTSLANALTELNAVTSYTTPGTIIFTCAAGGSETAPVTGFVIGSATLNPLLSATNTVTIVKASGTVTINAATGGSATPASAAPNGMISIRGADYITIDGLTLTDGNTTNNATMEFGIGLFKASLSDGARNNTIQNCIINMQRVNSVAGSGPMFEGSVGILMINAAATAATTALTPTTAAGTNSNNRFYTNTINSGNHGIGLSGFAATTPFTAGDTGNDIGGASPATGNTILNFGGGAGATTQANGIRANNQWSVNIQYNTVNNNNGSGINHPNILRGIYGQAGTSANATISNNTVTIKGGGTTHQVSAIENAIGSTAASNTININNNIVTGDYLTGTSGAFYGINNTASAATVNVTGNTINTISTAGTTVAGMLISSSATTVSQNKIYNIQSTSSGSTTVSGIIVSPVGVAGTTTLLNNLIGDLKSPNAVSASGADNVRGINLTSNTASSTINVYYNTVYLNATSAGSQFSTSGIFHTASATATTAALNMRNNIIFNTSVPKGTGVSAAYRRSATNLANYAATSNTNLFYAGTPSATNLLFVEGTSSLTNPQQTIAGYKTYVGGGRDAASITEDPLFQSTSGASPDFLKYGVVSVLKCESGAVNIPGITTDYIGTVRQGNGGYSGTGSAPDMGAWELEGFIDIIPPAIGYTSLGNTSCLSDRTITPVTITDATGINITAGTRPRLYYRKGTNANIFNNNTSATDGWKYVEATGSGGSPFSFTTNFSLLNGGIPVAGDVIHFFVVAQDLAAIPNVGINTGTFNTAPASVALAAGNFPVTGNNSFTMVGSIPATVTIGSGGTYPTLTGSGGLFEAINNQSLGANTTAKIISNTITETGAVVLNPISYNCAGPYTLTIKPDAGVIATVTGAYAGVLIRIRSSNVIIDGSNNGTSSRNLTVTNTSSTSPGVLLVGSTGTTAITNVTLKNSIMINGSQSTSSIAIMLSDGTSPGSAGYFNSITLQNNNIQKTYIGVFVTAVVSAGNGSGLLMTGNDLNTAGANGIRTIGFYCLGIDGATISNNNIGNIANTVDGSSITGIWFSTGTKNSIISGNNISGISGTAGAPRGIAISTGTAGANNINVTNNRVTNLSSSSAGTTSGIYLSGSTGGVKIWNNRISNIKNSNTSGQGSNGIHLTSTLTSGVADVYNNEIFDVASYGYPAVTSNANGYGIMVEQGGGYNIWFNSIRLTTNQTSTSGRTAAINISSFITTPGSLNIRNNIFANTQTIGMRYAIYCSATSSVFSNINNNNYYSTGSLGFMDGPQTILSGWQTAIGQDANSIETDPLFNSVTNLQPLIGSPVVAAGVTGTGISTDITGFSRGNPPAIGAYEQAGDSEGPVILYYELGNAFCINNRTLSSVVITDAASGINTTPGTRPRMYFKKLTDNNTYAGNTSGNNGWKFVEATGVGGSPFSFTTNFSLLQSAVAPGDIIQYFVVGQDQAITPNVSINSGTFSVKPANVALTASAFPITGVIYQFSILAGGLSTDVTIGAAGTYPSLTGAGGLFAAINASGITNNITARILDASIAETGANALNQISYGCAGSNILTIKPGVGVNTVLSGSVGSGALIKLNGADNVIFDGSNNGTSSRNMTITNTSTVSATALSFISLGTDAGAINNTIKNCNISTGSNTTASYGVAAGGSTPGTAGADNDNLTIQNNNITGVSVGVYANGTTATSTGGNDNLVLTQNLITVNTTATATNYGIQAGNGTGGTVSLNTISVTSDAPGQPVGISIETGFLNSGISRNKITKVNTTSPDEYGGRGITIGTASASSGITVSNNVIYGVNGSNYSDFASSSAIGIGIGIIGNSNSLNTVTGGVNMYFNSVNMYGDYSGNSATITTALYIGSGASALNIRNNIFSNSLNNTVTPLSYNYCIYSDADNTAFTSINYNDYYPVSSVNSTGFVGFLGLDMPTLAAWKTATGQDANSISVNPFFSANTNLQPQTGSGIFAAGVAGTGITTDITGFTRGTPPAMGAFELAAGDDSPPVIFYIPIPVTLCTNNRTLTATISDVSGVNTSAGNKPRLYFKKSADADTYGGNTSANNGWKYVEASNASSPFSFTTDFSLLQTPVTGGDIIQYFIIAQDLVGIPNVGINSGVFTANPINVALTAAAFPITGTVNSYTVLAGGLSGTVNVGPGQTYLTLTSAGGLFNAINSGGLTGNLVANITGNITTEDGSNALNTINFGCSGPATLTIKPTGTFTVSGSFEGGLIRLNSADNITIDGSTGSTANAVCPVSAASRNMTISNTNTSTESAVVWLQSNGIDGATGNKVMNCNLAGSGVTQTLFGVGSGSSTISDGSSGTGNNNNQFVNNNITEVQYGIYSRGQSEVNKNTGTVINQNTITASANTKGGIWVGYENGIIISGNFISNIAQASSPDVFGISCGFGPNMSASTTNGNEVTNAIITKNVIGSVVNSSGAFSAFGIGVSEAGSGTTLIANNMIYGVAANSSAGDIAAGIVVGGGAGSATNVFYNTVSMQGTITGITAAAETSACFVVTASTAPVLDLRNNIFTNTQTGNAGATLSFASIALGYTDFSTLTSNYNDLYCAGTGPGTYQIGITGSVSGGTGSTTLANWQATTGKDGASLNLLPNYVSSADLHLATGNNCALDGYGTPVSVTDDIDCNTRDVTTPDMGADEFTAAYSILAGVTGSATCKNRFVSVAGTIYATDACNLIARVLPSGGSPVSGNINVCVTLDAAQMYYYNQPYVQRHFDIEPAISPATATGTVTLYFTNSEFVNYNTNNPLWPAMPTVAGGGSSDPNRANLRVTQYHGTPTSSPSVAGSYTGAAEIIDPADSDITWNGTYWSVQFNVTGFSGFYVHTRKDFIIPVKVFLQGAYSTTLARHKNNTAAWVGALNAGTGGNALNQPYSAAPFSYTGTESVPAGYFKASANTTAPMDWVLFELRSGTNPATVITRRAALIRVDGRIVNLDSTSDLTFNNLPTGIYHLVIRHRNHLPVRTSNALILDGSSANLYDFTTAQAKAYQNPAVTTNAAMKEVSAGVFAIWGGNANGMTTGTNAVNQVKVSAPNPSNDYFYLFNTILSGNLLTVLSNVYHPADINMDGQVKMTAPNNTNDYFFLFNTVLSGNVSLILNQHQ